MVLLSGLFCIVCVSSVKTLASVSECCACRCGITSPVARPAVRLKDHRPGSLRLPACSETALQWRCGRAVGLTLLIVSTAAVWLCRRQALLPPPSVGQEAMQLHTGYATLPKKGNVCLTVPAMPKSETRPTRFRLE